MSIKRSSLFYILSIGTIVLSILACGTSNTEDTVTESELVTEGAEPMTDETEAPTEPEESNVISPGTYLVGIDIQPNIFYGEGGTSVWDTCYWARLSDLSGDLDAILANDNSVGQFYFEVLPTDYAFEVYCQVASLDSIPEPDEFLIDLDPGTYIVNRDIQAGLYKGDAGSEGYCYWERLTDVTGDFSSIIANDNSVGQFYVEVAPTDFALTIHCNVSYVGE